MKLNTYKKAKFIIFLLVLIGVSLSIYLNAVLLAVVSIGFGMVVNSFLKAQIVNPIADERLVSVSEKAAQTSFKVLLPILGLTSLALLYASGGPFYYLKSLGIILAYITILGLFIYLSAYYYYNRKFGG